MKFLFIRIPFPFKSSKSKFPELYLNKNRPIFKSYSCKHRMSKSFLNVAIKSKDVLTQNTEKVGSKAQHIIKSENDSMEYRLIELNNGLRAILVSDVLNLIDINTLNEPSAEESEGESESDENSEKLSVSNSFKEADSADSCSEEDDGLRRTSVKEGKEKMAACALCIGVGSFSDPPDIPGLAHFLEHMVFMGSSKYPKENGFDEFIQKHGGSDNGSTECETTLFYLECGEKYLKEGMDRFAQFFISPLMKREAMTRERQIIHSEFEMYLSSDLSRREHILASLAPAGHPAGKFQWGNLTTLARNVDDDVLYERVHEFRRRHYSANRMTVAIQARLPLDLLEEYIRETFSDIPSNDLPPEDFSQFIGSYGNPDSFNKIIWVKPVKDLCQINLTWVLPSYLKEYKSKPLPQVSWLIGHEGRGSLLSYLRKKVWALECVAGNGEIGFRHNSIFSLFTVKLTLTEEGYKRVNEVIGLIFCYINMLKQHCPNRAVYDELQKISDTDFRFKTEIPSADNVEILAESMHLFEPEHYLVGDELFMEYKPELITEILNLLTPDRVNVIIYSRDNPDSFYDRVEPWFQTKHKIEEIPPEWKKSWYEFPEVASFHIPKPNPYLTTDFSILPKPATNPPYPEKILDNPLQELWYRQDVKFKKPLATYCFYILSPKLKTEPINAVLLDVLLEIIDTKISEQSFEASHAGLHCIFNLMDLGIGIQCCGYNEKLPLYFDEVLKQLFQICREINDESNLEMFNAVLKRKSQIYYNKFLKPKKLARMVRLKLLSDHYWTAVEDLELLKHVTLQRLHDFAVEFFHGVRILGLIQGNISKEKSLELAEKFESVLHCTPLTEEKPQIRVTKLSLGEQYLRLKSFIEGDSNSVIVNYYQLGHEVRTSCLIDLLMMLMEEPLFDTLRTKQQIGYDISCFMRYTFGVLGFTITVLFQSHKFHPDEVDDRIEEFLKNFLKKLRSMSKKEFEETKASLVLLKNSADLHLMDEVGRNFSEIISEEYIFDRTQKETEIIPSISHKELCNFFELHIASGKNIRKLSIQIIGESATQSDTAENEGKSFSERVYKLTPLAGSNEKKDLFITDIENFRSKQENYPLKKKF